MKNILVRWRKALDAGDKPGKIHDTIRIGTLF
jgi:hypothetical protein